jgi:hypothetical protein
MVENLNIAKTLKGDFEVQKWMRSPKVKNKEIIRNRIKEQMFEYLSFVFEQIIRYFVKE